MSESKDDVIDFYDCELIHSKVPHATGKLIMDEDGCSRPEIVLKCKEGCDD